MTSVYRIVIRGRVAERYLDQYRDEFTITPSDAYTVLAGAIRDASQLHGIVAHLTNAGLELIEVTSS